MKADASYDAIVVGAGAAGLATTLAAATAGARVLLLDKTNLLGGMLHIANGEMSGAGTRRQQERGIDDDPRRHFTEVRRLSHDKCNPDLTWRSVEAQGDTIDWLQKLGLDFAPQCPELIHGHEVYQVPRTYWGTGFGRSVLDLLLRHLQPLVDDGTVTLTLDAQVDALLTDADGAITGVTWQATDGPRTASARAVVLAAGGYDANKQLRDEFLPAGCDNALIGCLDHATGDGLQLASALGAQVTHDGYFIPIMGLIPDPDRPGFAVDYRIASVQLPPRYRTPYEIWVNTEGKRFVAEDTESPELRERALLAQPGLTMHIVWDRAAAELSEPLLTNTSGTWTKQTMAQATETGTWIRRASTIAELAAEVGVDPAALQATVDRYNEFVSRGIDDDFGRGRLPRQLLQPPFYCLTTVAASILSRDGLVVDTNTLTVRHSSGSPIRGLHAVGEILGNNTFAGDNYVGGMSITPALTLGRLLGTQLSAQSRLN